ncbi:hypothetical protein M1146_06140 [Patescibacteria group bacterium]|nr:hypothetical protein [Patescibacteria group bacterium]
MKQAIVFILMMVIYITLWLGQIDTTISEVAQSRLQKGLIRATHDAALQTQQDQMGNGLIIFNQVRALEVFKNSLADNMALLPETLDPKSSTLFKQRATIEYMEYIDDSTGHNFPFLYENPTYNITKMVYGPAIVAVVSIQRPKIYAYSLDFTMRKAVVYEYPIPN